jgi:hypothetical protein
MTTIAFDGEVIAYDSRETQGSLICNDNCNKHHIKDGVHFFIAGTSGHEGRLISAFLDGPEDDYPDSLFSTAIVVRDGDVFECAIDKDEGYWSCAVTCPIALGSGSRHALTAMDCGLSAKDAVKMAIKRDANSGGRVRTFRP